ncbi:MAG: DUF2007 domain-containing protein [Prevotellaceae bacterium]|jgi:hypothetical protein|nr:DUF2007 domain-containing protein [Prevotellaceae bacterium]
MRVLTDCKNDFEASIIVGRLESEGIKAIVMNKHINDIWPFNSLEYFAAVKVVVSEEDYDQAMTIISTNAPPIEPTPPEDSSDQNQF